MTKKTKEAIHKESKKPTVANEKKVDTKHLQEKKSTASAQGQMVDWQEKYIRLYAEFENYKKRTAKQQVSWISMANKNLMVEFLPIVEDFERALSSNVDKEAQLSIPKEGVALIYDKFIKTLTKQGLSPMPIKQGDSFDPDYHEALTVAPTDDQKLKGKIVEVVSKGYMIEKNIIKTAKVIIGK